MRHKVMMAVIMVGMAVLLIGGSLMATHNDSLTIPLFAAGEVVPTGGLSIDGTNTLALPYIPDGRVDDAHKLGLDIGGFDLLTGGPVLNIQRLLRNGNVLEPYNGSKRGNNFELIGGVGYRVRVKHHVDYTAAGSHDESLQVTFLAAGSPVPEGGVSIDGTNVYAAPYHGTALRAHDLSHEIGGYVAQGEGSVFNVQRLLPNGNVLEAYDGSLRCFNFPLIPGQAYRVRVQADIVFVPSHF